LQNKVACIEKCKFIKFRDIFTWVYIHFKLTFHFIHSEITVESSDFTFLKNYIFLLWLVWFWTDGILILHYFKAVLLDLKLNFEKTTITGSIFRINLMSQCFFFSVGLKKIFLKSQNLGCVLTIDPTYSEFYS
jgi:hypothetical protein